MGSIYGTLNKNKKALNCFNKALEINPNETKSWYGKGAVFIQLKEHEKALKYLNKSLKVDPNFEPAKEIKEKLAKDEFN